MKLIFLKFGSNARINSSPASSAKHTSGDAGFSTPPMGANPPTDFV